MTALESFTHSITMPAKIQVDLDEEDVEKLSVIPWFSYRVNLPERPIPPVPERPHMKTQRLLIRPICASDLQQFHDLRQLSEIQIHSPSRGRVDCDLEETRRNIERFESSDGDTHWYYGAFLLSTGQMIGEGGLPDCNSMPRSGWPEAEIFIRPEFQRQGYGTEFLKAVLESWWALPREVRRHQLLPVIAGDSEPGDRVVEGVGFVWEQENTVARDFFAKALAQNAVAAEGVFVAIDQRDGRFGNLVHWNGTLASNPYDSGED